MNMEHQVKAKHGGLITVPGYGRAKAIKVFCSECVGWTGNPKKDCTSPTCPLYPYRGKSLAANGEIDENEV